MTSQDRAVTFALQDFKTALAQWGARIHCLTPDHARWVQQWLDREGFCLIDQHCISSDPEVATAAVIGLHRLGTLLMAEVIDPADADRFCDWVLDVPAMLRARIQAASREPASHTRGCPVP